MKVSIDHDLCIGCGVCPSVAPELFEMNDDGLADPLMEEVPSDLEDDAEEAADSCPVAAIILD